LHSTLTICAPNLPLSPLFRFPDLAKSIYANATLEKLALLRHLATRERQWRDIGDRVERGVESMRGVAEGVMSGQVGFREDLSGVIGDVGALVIMSDLLLTAGF
jgi:hypothetical protein